MPRILPEKTMKLNRNQLTFVFGGAALFSGAAFLFAYLPSFGPVIYENTPSVGGAVLTGGEVDVEPPVLHIPTPEPVHGLYMTQCIVGTPLLRNNLIQLVKDTSLNTVVIDIKDYSGTIAFRTGDPLFAGAELVQCGASDMKEFIKKLHEDGIYVVGRITVFQDPYYTSKYPEAAVKRASDPHVVWEDYKGLAFVDVGARTFWDYIVALSKASYAIGFDELNFDYIRYPSDGNMKDTYYSHSLGKEKSVALEEFYVYLNNALKPVGVVLSADLFGMVTTNEDDLNIGQVLERALPYFDYIDPMVYPSHYPKGFRGHVNVNEHAYDIVNFSLARAVERTIATTTRVASFVSMPIASTTPQLYEKPAYPASRIRPWLQSFDYPVVYTPDMVDAQIRATHDAGLESYLFWDAANKYRSLREVLTQTAITTEI